MNPNSKGRNRRRSKQRIENFNLEELSPPVVTIADQRTMAQLLHAPTEGYEDAIVVPAITADNFKLKHGLITLVQNKQFFGHDKEDPHAHIRYFNKSTSTLKFLNVLNMSIKLMLFLFSLEGAARIYLEKEPPRSIFTWDDLVLKFINQFFHLSKTTSLRNKITNFQQRFDESFSEAWDRFKNLLRACPHHGFSELHQLDTFYNALNSKDQDSLNFGAGGSGVVGFGGSSGKMMYSVFKMGQGNKFGTLSLLGLHSYKWYFRTSPLVVNDFGRWQEKPSMGYIWFAQFVLVVYNFRDMAVLPPKFVFHQFALSALVTHTRHTQEEGIDYDEVFAPIARIEAIKLFLAYASFKDFVVYQMDVKSAFLYGKIEEEVYVCQPPGFEDPVDYIRPQEHASTPMEPNKALVKDVEAEDVDVHLYRSMIGSLMYLTASRPDITFAVCACVRFQVTLKTFNLHAVKRIFRYLKGQPKLGLWYSRDSPFDLETYSDSDYAGASLDRKSTTEGYQFFGKRLISWQCKKQTIVANFTTKAEYVAAASCCGHMLWIQIKCLIMGSTS
nr:uncharacterized mitochondrial protein AtMg00810-like [Tanacetum cinerariifolium]